MKEKLTRNVGLKILSIVLAALLWIVITNIDDPYKTKRFTGIEVKVLNEEVIEHLNQEYDITEGETINIKVEARKSIIDKLRNSDFIATADFRHLSDVNAVRIEISCPKYGEAVEIIDGKYQEMLITRDVLDHQDKKVNIVVKGEVAKGFTIAEKTASPNMITVSGAKGRVDKISEITVEVDATNKSRPFNTTAALRAYDANGKLMDTDKLTFEYDNQPIETVDVSVSLYRTKTINLSISIAGKPAEGYSYAAPSYSPEQITIAGTDEMLKDIKYLPITVDITGANKNIEKEIDPLEWLPKGVILVNDTTIALNIKIEELDTKEMTVGSHDIDIHNLKDNCSITYNTTGGIYVVVNGSEEDIEYLTEEDLKPRIDLTDYSVGTYSAEIEFDLPEGVNLVNKPTISFNIIEK
ncbi:MAG: hypothetical protein K0S47_2423 [Herbinix sp.]|nr:hypothetical protein [Herbinix sp.]